jgi:hypothetical protein
MSGRSGMSNKRRQDSGNERLSFHSRKRQLVQRKMEAVRQAEEKAEPSTEGARQAKEAAKQMRLIVMCSRKYQAHTLSSYKSVLPKVLFSGTETLAG